jgi:hypothetical protein
MEFCAAVKLAKPVRARREQSFILNALKDRK